MQTATQTLPSSQMAALSGKPATGAPLAALQVFLNLTSKV